MIEYYKSGKLAHAYLISTNNIQKSLEILLKVIKNIFCVNEFNDNCKKCSLCHLIDINNLPSLKIIEPDGNFIRKNQILELQNLFSKESQFTKENIYIIKDCEKMNKESANTMLKFLEEPNSNVIGFFLTTHADSVLPTIISRCQTVTDNYNNTFYEEINIDKEKFEQYFDSVKNYLLDVEFEQKQLIVYNRKYLLDYEKDDIISIMQIILKIYELVLTNEIDNYEEFSSLTILKKLSNRNILKKMELITEILKELTYNVNLELIMDRFVIELERINNEGV